MDEKYYRRFESFRKSLAVLKEIRERDLNDSFILSGAGAKFNITFDLAWKVMKDIVIQRFAVVDFPKGSPREVLRKAYEFQLISDDAWMDMLRDRNDLMHDYDGEIVKTVCERLINCYLALFEAFQETVETRYLPEREDKAFE